MAHGDIAGRARTDPRNPRAQGVSDFSGCWYQRGALKRQMEWSGTQLVWTGMLVPDCEMDKPNPQLRALRLPADPVPVMNPRPEDFQAANMPSGFTQYSMWPQGQPLPYGVELTDGNGNLILTNTGQPILLEIGSDGPALLAQLAQITGIPIPGNIQSYNATIGVQNVAQTLVPASPTRTYIAIFNPCTDPICVSTGTAVMGVVPSITLGSGGCLFWATAQNYGAPWPGAMTVVGQYPGVPLYAYSN